MSTINNSDITIEKARQIAEEAARKDLFAYMSVGLTSALQEEFLEADNCWMFFRNQAINVPPEAQLGIKWAYAVSKKGDCSMVQDLSDDPEKLQAYLQTMSNYFKERGK